MNLGYSAIWSDGLGQHGPRLVLLHHRHHSPTWNCKILLPKFNTCGQVLLELKKGSLLSLFGNGGWFSAKKFCLYAVIVSALRREADAITAQRRCDYGVKPTASRRNADAKSAKW